MKICIKCGGITEEKRAIKCAVCGADISDSIEYTEDEILHSNILKETLVQTKKRNQRRIRLKKLVFALEGLALILGVCLIVFLLEIPRKGHIILTEADYEIRIGETVVVTPIYSEKLTGKDLGIRFKNGNQQSISVRLDGDSFYFTGLMVDELLIEFIVNDDGNQSLYNTQFTITIKAPKGHLHIEQAIYNYQINQTFTIRPILSTGIKLADVSYIIDSEIENGLYITIIDGEYFIEAKKVGTYQITFTLEDDGEQALYNNKVIININY